MELSSVISVPCDDRHGPDEVALRVDRKLALGIDLGQAHDPTAICVASRITVSAMNPAYAAFNPHQKARYEVHHLERLKLGMPYPRQVDHIADLLLRDPLVRLRPAVLVDYTGVGRPVFDMFVERPALRRAEGVVITGGRDVATIPAGWSVPKAELVSKLQALLHSGLLKIPRSIPDAPVLARELQEFRVRYTEAGNAVFNAREGQHDDLVLALALAVFGLTRPEPPGPLKVRWVRRGG